MNRSNMIEALENRDLFSANATVATVRAPQPAAIIGDLHQPLSYSASSHGDARPHDGRRLLGRQRRRADVLHRAKIVGARCGTNIATLHPSTSLRMKPPGLLSMGLDAGRTRSMTTLLVLGSKPDPVLPPREAFDAVACANASGHSARRYGLPGYARLAPECAQEIFRGADDESEMGVYHDLYEPQRRANLRARLDQHTPAGMTVGLLFAD